MKKPHIAVDAMGHDRGPAVIVPGAVNAAREDDLRISLVGDEQRVREVLSGLDVDGLDVEVVHASQIAGMSDKPTDVLRRKKDSSIHVASRMVKDAKADGLVSAGNSGAVVACGMFVVGRIDGVERPALAGIMPTVKEPVLLIDVGANVDSKPQHLLQFGQMADVFSKDVLGVESPRVGLLSIGEEEGKGNIQVKDAFDLLRNSPLNFVGNVEGRDVFTGDVDVIVCDGFVGNVVLKLSEGLAINLGKVLKRELTGDVISKVGAGMAMRGLKRFAKFTDYAEYGGAPLLGLNGIVVACHGASNEKAVANAVKMAATFIRSDASTHLSRNIALGIESQTNHPNDDTTRKTA